MTEPCLRDYQAEMIAEVRENFRRGLNSQLIVSPTGSGKTIAFSYMAQSASRKGKRVGILCHRVELLAQICAALERFEVDHAVVAPGHLVNRKSLVQVASVFALARRLNVYPQFDLLIIDEAHHAIPGSTWGAVIAANPQAKLLGVTATPERLSGHGLGDFFKTMVLGPSTASLIERGWLSPYRLYAPATCSMDGVHSRMGDFVKAEMEAVVDKPSITGDAVTHYLKLLPNQRALAFCVSIKHATHVAEQFRQAGVVSSHIDGEMDRVERAQKIRDFTAGRIHVLTSCDLISEGFDCPEIDAAILLRPTQSLALYLQQVGRSLRIAPGKRVATLLDHCNNVGRHGLPDDEREWTLEGRATRRKSQSDDAVAIKTCGTCFATVHASKPICPHCGTPFPVKAREVEHVEGDLVEVDPIQARIEKFRAQSAARDEQQLIELGRKRNMKRPELWARHVLRARAEKAARQRALQEG